MLACIVVFTFIFSYSLNTVPSYNTVPYSIKYFDYMCTLKKRRKKLILFNQNFRFDPDCFAYILVESLVQFNTLDYQ